MVMVVMIIMMMTITMMVCSLSWSQDRYMMLIGDNDTYDNDDNYFITQCLKGYGLFLQLVIRSLNTYYVLCSMMLITDNGTYDNDDNHFIN
jgi:hypothetical protein